ncbi:MAG: LysR family transcriptional regulator [Acidovorax sp.]|jgi:DNA-binding transcriptional LysR family regulator|nr:LysR family transcriptional regulator [Acidovorax sp.]
MRVGKNILPSMTALQCFEAVARRMSFTLAAHDLCLTQGAVSKQIAQLEALLHQQLFHRSPQGLLLTPAGKMYLADVRQILNQVDISARYVMGYGKAEETLSVAVQPTFGACWLIPRLGHFMRANPDIQVVTRSDTRPFDLVQARIDISLFYGNGSLPGADCHRLFDAPVIAVCSPQYLAQALEQLELMQEHTLIQCSSRPEIWRDWFAHQGWEPMDCYQGPRFDTFTMCLTAALEGLGIAAMPAMFAQTALQQGLLVQPWPHVQPSEGAYFVACASDCAEVPKVKTFVQWVLTQAAA